MFSKYFLILACLVLSTEWLSVDACKCLPLAEPRYCRTQFLALVKITGVQTSQTERKKFYTFDLVEDLTFARSKGKLVLNAHVPISTSLSTASCGVDLENGVTYLLGGSFKNSNDTQNPFLFSCRVYVENWESKSTNNLIHYKETCEKFDSQQQ